MLIPMWKLCLLGIGIIILIWLKATSLIGDDHIPSHITKLDIRIMPSKSPLPYKFHFESNEKGEKTHGKLIHNGEEYEFKVLPQHAYKSRI